MQSLFRDVHYALVTLRRMPGLTLTVLVTLALAVGVTTAVFTVVHALGATRGALVALVLREGVAVTLAAIGVGIVAASIDPAKILRGE
jgi:hypothetical protein